MSAIKSVSLYKEAYNITRKILNEVVGALSSTGIQNCVVLFDKEDEQYHVLLAYKTSKGDQIIHESIGSLDNAKIFFKSVYGDDCDFDGNERYFINYHQYQHNVAARATEDIFLYKTKQPEWRGEVA